MLFSFPFERIYNSTNVFGCQHFFIEYKRICKIAYNRIEAIFEENRLIFFKKCVKMSNKCSVAKPENFEFTFLGLSTQRKKE